jgi:ribosomal protein S18 acetylase RimI-like enzyme
MEQLSTLSDVVAASGADPQCIWAAQGMRNGGGAWAHDGAVAVAAPGLGGRNRIVVRGRPAAASRVVRAAVDALGPGYQVAGDPDVMAGILRQICWLQPGEHFGWMDATRQLAHRRVHEVRWLARNEWRAADDLLTEAAPGTDARPWQPGVHRWAGITDSQGRLTSTAADAWSVPGVGFLAGLVVRPEVRHLGQGQDVCAFLLDALLAAHGRAAMIIPGSNAAAVRMCGRIGFTYRQQHAARMIPAAVTSDRAVVIGQI